MTYLGRVLRVVSPVLAAGALDHPAQLPEVLDEVVGARGLQLAAPPESAREPARPHPRRLPRGDVHQAVAAQHRREMVPEPEPGEYALRELQWFVRHHRLGQMAEVLQSERHAV